MPMQTVVRTALTARHRGLGIVLSGMVVAACTGAPGPSAAASVASEAVWRRLERPRAARLADAPRVTVSEIVLLSDPWGIDAPLDPAIGLQELISAGLLRRADVDFVERRRYAAAVDRERDGLPRRPNAPAIGVSPGAEMMLTGSWIATGDSAALDLRLADVESGRVRVAWRSSTPASADPTAVARLAVGGLLATLRELDRLPSWNDPLERTSGGIAPPTYVPAAVGLDAVAAFMRGVAAEDRYDWEAARRGYQRALELAGPAFVEADVALARVARLRAGGTLGGSEP